MDLNNIPSYKYREIILNAIKDSVIAFEETTDRLAFA
jgi:hypothetical protein